MLGWMPREAERLRGRDGTDKGDLMRRFIQTLSLFTAIALGVGPAAAQSTKAEKDVLAAVEALKEGTMKKDRATLEKVLHPDLSYGHSNGNVETKEQAIAHIVENPGTYEAINWADTKVRIHGNTALVTGKIDMQQKNKENRTQSNLIALTVWLKGSKGWQLVARQTTRPVAPGQTAAAAPPTPPAAPAAAKH
jgi:ketosteroid isomerase-like protein